MGKFTHFDDKGNSHMVDVSNKMETSRIATAKCRVIMKDTTARMISNGGFEKGDVLSVAQLAGIMGAKYTPSLIPLCHPLNLTSVNVFLEVNGSGVDIIATCKINGQTGVEMEALTAVSVSGLTIYDMCKSVDKSMHITNIRLTHKNGGKSGEFIAH